MGEVWVFIESININIFGSDWGVEEECVFLDSEGVVS